MQTIERHGTRVDPLAPPFPAELQAVFDRIMPPGVPPLPRRLPAYLVFTTGFAPARSWTVGR